MDKLGKCPNAGGCQVLNIPGFVKSVEVRDLYFKTYCSNDTIEGFFQCKRFQTKKSLGFCPEFILPDTVISMDEIMDKCEE